MNSYEFQTVWELNAPVESVWEVIRDVPLWPEWWRGVLSVTELSAGDEAGVGSVHRTVWKSALPYKLEFDSEVVRVDPLRLIEARAFGELDGVGIWKFEKVGDRCRIEYVWRVSTNKKWMNLLAPIARPFFKWNHDVIMNWGETGLASRLGDGENLDTLTI